MTQHTPGPWYVANGPRYHIRSKERGQIFPSGADGRLMAAAPDLLAALKDVELRTTQARIANSIGKKKDSAQFLLGELERIAIIARAAIAKATEGE